MKKWIITITYPKNFLQLFEHLQDRFKLFTFYEPRSLKTPSQTRSPSSGQAFQFKFEKEVYNFLASISLHEFGHSKECPIDVHYFSSIIQAISTYLEQQDSFNRKILCYIANLFTDTVVNTLYGLNADNAFFRNGLFTFHASELILYDSTDISFLYFVLLNLKLFQFHVPIRNALETIILHKMPKDYKVKLHKLIELFCPFPDLARNLNIGVVLTENERWKIINYVSERDNWDIMAYEFTKLLYDDVSKNLLEDRQPIPDSLFTKLFEEDTAFQKEVFDHIIEKKMKANNTSEQKDPVLKEKYKGELDIDSGLNLFHKIEIYDGIYRYRTKEMLVKVPNEHDNTKYVITWLNREILTDGENPINFDPLKAYFLPKSEEILLFKKTVPLTTDLEGTSQEEGFPNLAIFCDDSGSMTWEPATGMGKYDALIITIYSLLNWLKGKSFAPVIKYNFTFFSTTTRTTGWLDYFNLDDLKPFLFYHEGGTTELSPDIFDNIIKDPKKKAVLMITDGEIFKNKPILNILKKNKNSIIFLFIQIGKLSNFARKLKTNGFNVMQIRNIGKLNQIVLNFFKETYETLKNY
ncbi:MAG: hypothetical protein ACTSO9_16365 [Candidatus Helarchaeota archaeon]